MKKIVISSALCAAGLLGSVGAFAADTTICTGSATAGNGTAPASGTAGTHYMVRAIAPKCSANVNLLGVDGTSGAWYAVGSNSVKGKASWQGHTNGGSVQKGADCAIPGGCTADEATTARTAANAAAAAAS